MKKHSFITLLVLSLLTATTMSLYFMNREVANEKPLVSPIPESSVIPTPTISVSVTASPTPTVQIEKRLRVEAQPRHSGMASYYSRSGCVGCSANRTMANGQPLDDSKLTVAFNRAKLNSKVKVTNVKTGLSVVATVTDRGGFEAKKYNVKGRQRIIDLTVATKDAIQCSHLCAVEVEAL